MSPMALLVDDDDDDDDDDDNDDDDDDDVQDKLWYVIQIQIHDLICWFLFYIQEVDSSSTWEA